MSAHSQPSPAEPSATPDRAREHGEVLDAVPVLASEPVQERALSVQRVARVLTREARPGSGLPAVQAAAVAAGGFVAGAAVVGLVHRRQRSAPALARGGGRIGRALARGSSRKAAPPAQVLQVVGRHSLLVDVHVLGVPDGLR